MRISDWSSDVCSSDLHARIIDDRVSEALADVGTNIGDTMGLRNLGKVTDPGQATSPGELFPCLAGLAADMAIAGMIDEEIELWPILRSFGDIAHIGIAPKVWVTLLQSLGEQSLVDANIGKTGLHRLLIEGI